MRTLVFGYFQVSSLQIFSKKCSCINNFVKINSQISIFNKSPLLAIIAPYKLKLLHINL